MAKGKVKMKTNRSAAKRFKVTATGKVLHKKSGKSHLLRKKNRKTKRHLGKYKEIFKGFYSHIKECIPYKF
ncbi:MAG: 50S ribosomal protein L35 [Thermodesulfobacteria bacterium]|nr:50S ribosomal protein L35 [Thermodesulfobacteriota bacterium]